MPSLEESRRQVQDSLGADADPIDHGDILANLQDEIDKHNAVKDDLRSTMRQSRQDGNRRDDQREEPPMRFRFKSGISDPRKRKTKHTSHEKDSGRPYRKRTRHYPAPQGNDIDEAHPFPREPANPDPPGLDSTDAFRESLFDALADDEGAQYWESVYSQPIHVYPRPTVEKAPGELEQMHDEEYAAYVKLKMWEKKNPHIVLERERAERKRREQEEARTREREEFVRRKEQAGWERSQRRSARRAGEDSESEGYEYTFSGGKEYVKDAKHNRRDKDTAGHTSHEYRDAWTRYLQAWDKLKHELLDERGTENKNPSNPSQRIPWPVIATKPVVKTSIENFMRHAPSDKERSMLQMLKVERVRWHPDKVQQRFGGAVDDGTMKLVTGVFQVVDALFEEERKRSGSGIS